jgi:hypothetical protein
LMCSAFSKPKSGHVSLLTTNWWSVYPNASYT